MTRAAGLCARGRAYGARPAAVLRPVPVRLRPDGLRDLPRPRARLRAAQRTARPARRQRPASSPGCAPCRRSRICRRCRNSPSIIFDSEDEGDESVDNGPTGGLTWDGRVDRGRDQARIPLLSPFEMANDDEAAVAAKLRQAAYAGEVSRRSSATMCSTSDGKTFAAVVEALEVFEQSEHDFYPYSSKYDAYLAGHAEALAAGGARPRAVQRSGQGQLRKLPSQRAAAMTARRRSSPITA